MSECKKRIAIIGAGASGLVGIKCCLDEGLEPVCFERTDSIGGLWNFTPNPIEGQGCIMKSTVINTSKEMMCYSDFPIPAKYPIFMHNTQVFDYFNLYADNFKLKEHIRFNTEVISLKRADDFSTTGQWIVHSKNRLTAEEKTETYDGALVCSGHHADKYDPELPGLKNFKGTVVHTHDFRQTEKLIDKRVLVVGIGNSGGDLAVELSRIASQVFMSTRRGTWILNRVAEYGIPADMANLSRVKMLGVKYCGHFANIFMKYQLNKRINHDMYGLTPNFDPFQQHPTVNDDLPNRIASGSIKIRPDLKQFTENGIEFVDGTKEDNIDVVIKATGYSFGFPYVEKGVLDVVENRVELFKYMFNPDLAHPTLAVIGCFQPLGAIMPICELQCRLATRVFKGILKLPSHGEMWEDIRKKESAMAKRYVKTRRHTIQVDYVPFSDELAKMIGCMPDIWSVMKGDPRLGFELLFGPTTPYHFRLTGPGKWSGAREAIMTQWERVYAPLKTRQIPKKSNSDMFLWKAFLGSLIIFFLLRFVFF